MTWSHPLKSNENKITGLGMVYFDGSEGTRCEFAPKKFEALAPNAKIILHRDDVICCYNHEFSKILGRQSNNTLQLLQTKDGLQYEVQLNEKDPEHQSIKAKIDRGDIASSSATFRPTKQYVKGDTILYSEIELYEIGPVPMPAMTASTAFSGESNSYSNLLFETQKRLQQITE